MKKTHVPDLSITGRQCHNRQLALRFCVGRGVGWSVGSSARMSTGRSVGSSARSRNVVHFSPVTPEKHELALGSIKT